FRLIRTNANRVLERFLRLAEPAQVAKRTPGEHVAGAVFGPQLDRLAELDDGGGEQFLRQLAIAAVPQRLGSGKEGKPEEVLSDGMVRLLLQCFAEDLFGANVVAGFGQIDAECDERLGIG